MSPEQAEKLVAAAIDWWSSGDPGSYTKWLEPEDTNVEVKWFDDNEAEIQLIVQRLIPHLVHEVAQGYHWSWPNTVEEVYPK